MAINFYKYHDQIVQAYKEVLDAKCPINWALFGYEKQSNDLMLITKGDTGLEELYEEFSQSKILYAFCEVKDDSLNIRRYLLINWQGECAPLQRKGVCMNHFADVRSFFKDANIVLNARHEDDVEPEVLMQHVNKLASRIRIDKQTNGGSIHPTTNGNDSHDHDDDNSKPVGTNYQRTVAQREISLKERERFWNQQKQEEEQRLKEEKMKQSANRFDMKAELQRNCQTTTTGQESPIKTNQSQLLRKERMEEAKSLISKNSISNARAFFEQNSSTPAIQQQQQQQLNCQSQSTKSSTAASNYVNHVQSMLLQKQPEHTEPEQQHQPQEQQQQQQPISVNSEEVDDVVEKVIESNQNSNDGGEDESSSDESFHTNPVDDQQQQQQQYGYYNEPRQLENIEEEQNEEDDESNKRKDELETVSQGLCAKALYDYQAADDTEISFDPDDIITHIEQIDAGWWQGLSPNGAYGLFPANYVELLDN